MMTKFHFYFCNRLQALYEAVRDGKDQNIDIEVQPQIGKSITVSELFLAWLLGKEPWPLCWLHRSVRRLERLPRCGVAMGYAKVP